MAITQGYATLIQVKAALGIADGIDDPLLEMAVESASRQIDSYTERYFYNGGTALRKCKLPRMAKAGTQLGPQLTGRQSH
jgi:predicted nucleotidyltransferase component of viral defense system